MLPSLPAMISAAITLEKVMTFAIERSMPPIMMANVADSRYPQKTDRRNAGHMRQSKIGRVMHLSYQQDGNQDDINHGLGLGRFMFGGDCVFIGNESPFSTHFCRQSTERKSAINSALINELIEG